MTRSAGALAAAAAIVGLCLVLTLLAAANQQHQQHQQQHQQQQPQQPQQPQQQKQQLTITIPDVRPDHAEQYLCMAHRVPERSDGSDSFVVGFNPRGDASRVHHMLMYGCELPGIFQRDSPNFVWDCGEMLTSAGSGSSADQQQQTFERGPVCNPKYYQQIMYGWALNAPALKLPDGVGFKVGGQSGIRFFVVQVHYGHYHAFSKQPDLTDNSGLVLDLRYQDANDFSSKSAITRQAGVLLFYSLGKVLPGNSRHEIWCDIEDNIEIHPFRFRVHTHKLGSHVMGAKIANGARRSKTGGSRSLTQLKKQQERQYLAQQRLLLGSSEVAPGPDEPDVIIGEGDPQKPQMFYPVKEKDLTIRGGDSVYVYCEFNNNQTHSVKIGPSGDLEMCNFYLMYWTDGPDLLSKNSCGSFNPPQPNANWLFNY